MDKKLEQKLYDDFPILYSNRHLHNKESSMCYGIQCDDGWFKLIYKLSEKLEAYNNIIEPDWMEKNPQVKASSVKEKLGGLRFYMQATNHPDEIYAYIRLAENMSYGICEKCGKNDTSVTRRQYILRLKTLCESCWDNENRISPSI